MLVVLTKMGLSGPLQMFHEYEAKLDPQAVQTHKKPCSHERILTYCHRSDVDFSEASHPLEKQISFVPRNEAIL